MASTASATLTDADLDALAERIARRLVGEQARLIDRQELATRLGIGASTLDRWARLGRIPRGIQVGGVERWDWAQVVKVLGSQGRRRRKAGGK